MIGDWGFIVMNKKILVLTGTTDILRSPTETDSTMEEVYDLTLSSKERYAKKHGYDLLSLRSFGSDFTNTFKPTHLGFLRALRSFEMLQNYDIVMWIDADTIITNLDYSISDFCIDENHSLYASWDWSGKNTISMGNFILQKTSSIHELFSHFMQIGKQIADDNIWGEEQTTINTIYKNYPIGKTIKILEHKFLGSIPNKKMFNGIWDGRPETPFPWTPESFLVHLTGIPNRNRIDVAKTTFKDYL